MFAGQPGLMRGCISHRTCQTLQAAYSDLTACVGNHPSYVCKMFAWWGWWYVMMFASEILFMEHAKLEIPAFKNKTRSYCAALFCDKFASNALTPTLACRRFGHRLKACCVVRTVALGNKQALCQRSDCSGSLPP